MQSIYKVVLVGDSGSGKSSLVRRQVEGDLNPDSKPTVGVKLTTMSAEAHSNTVKMKIWDTAGQERYRAPTNYYDGADGVMLVYDVSQRSTYDNVSLWLGEVRDHADAKVGLVLVGNKSDLAAQRTTTYEEGQSFASANGMLFVETSAANEENVPLAFQSLLQEICK